MLTDTAPGPHLEDLLKLSCSACGRVYMAGSGSAVLFCLHGCGYTGLTWAAVAAAVKDRFASPCASALTLFDKGAH